MDKRILALIAALLATSIFGLNYTIAKELMPNVLSPNALLYCRVLGAAVLFWFISFFLKWEKVEIKDLAGDDNHYAATVTSNLFKGINKVNQHKMVYEALDGKMGGVLHALSLTTLTPKD